MNGNQMSDTVQVSIDESVMTVTINRPQAKNAVNREVAEAISAAVKELDSNPTIHLAILTGAGGLLRTPRLIPQRVAMEMALTGEMISAARAYDLGLVNRVVASGGALNAALTLARVIAANGPLAIALSKKVISESQDWLSNEMFTLQEPLLQAIAKSKDAMEGATAFAEKRRPTWKGC
jgi:enoyl-CoA hydratase